MPNVDVWLWRMRHATLPFECGYRIERPPVPHGDYLYAVVTVDGRVLRSADGKHLLFTFANCLEQLLSLAERLRTELRKDGWRDVEDDA